MRRSPAAAAAPLALCAALAPVMLTPATAQTYAQPQPYGQPQLYSQPQPYSQPQGYYPPPAYAQPAPAPAYGQPYPNQAPPAQPYLAQGYPTQGYGQPAPAPAYGPDPSQRGRIPNFFSCGAGGSKQTAGTAAGALVGGLLGSQVSKNERALGAVIGAGLGAALGSWYGCRLQTQDQARAQQAAELALLNGQNQSWRNPQTGAYGEVRVVNTSYQGGYAAPAYAPAASLDGLRLASGVQIADYEAGAGQYLAPGQVNLRSAPSTSGRVVGTLRANERFDALARVRGQPWILVGRGGQGVGYVSETVVRPVGAPTTYAQAGAAAGDDGRPYCRTIEQSIATPGAAPQAETYRACRDAQGAWTIARA